MWLHLFLNIFAFWHLQILADATHNNLSIGSDQQGLQPSYCITVSREWTDGIRRQFDLLTIHLW